MADPGFANGGPRSSAAGASIEAPKAPRVWGADVTCPTHSFDSFYALFHDKLNVDDDGDDDFIIITAKQRDKILQWQYD